VAQDARRIGEVEPRDTKIPILEKVEACFKFHDRAVEEEVQELRIAKRTEAKLKPSFTDVVIYLPVGGFRLPPI
jgi:hypothetical protein